MADFIFRESERQLERANRVKLVEALCKPDETERNTALQACLQKDSSTDVIKKDKSSEYIKNFKFATVDYELKTLFEDLKS